MTNKMPSDSFSRTPVSPLPGSNFFSHSPISPAPGAGVCTPATPPPSYPSHKLKPSVASIAGASLTQQRVPTGTASEPLNIVILGASFAGLSCAHHFLDHTISHLRITSTAPAYRLIIISPSTHIYWNIGAPRALVKPGLIKHEDAFIPIEPGFHRHRGHMFTIVQGQAESVDTSERSVTVELFTFEAQKRLAQILPKRSSRSLLSPTHERNWSTLPRRQTIPYHALICCTGSSAHSDLLSLHGEHLNTISAINAFHGQVAQAKSIVVCGGGSSGVEVSGQLATWLNYTYPFGPFFPRKVKNPKQIILITGGSRVLPALSASVAAKAERMLRKLGVDIRHGVRVVAAKEWFDQTGATKIELNDNTTLIADLYIACTGVSPNSAYMPASLRDQHGYILTNPSSMRCDLAGPRVYALGDVASYSQNYVLDVYAAVPTAMHNLLNDLLIYELQLANTYGGNADLITELKDETYRQSGVDSQLCPISRFGGAGMIVNNSLPRLMVHLLKGHDYRVCKAKRVVVDGGNPYAVKNNYE